jgi:hypothetical protein
LRHHLPNEQVMEDVVDSNTSPDYPYFVSISRFHGEPYRSELSSAQAAPNFVANAELIVALLLSLGLWGAIWVAGCSFVSLLTHSIPGY